MRRSKKLVFFALGAFVVAHVFINKNDYLHQILSWYDHRFIEKYCAVESGDSKKELINKFREFHLTMAEYTPHINAPVDSRYSYARLALNAKAQNKSIEYERYINLIQADTETIGDNESVEQVLESIKEFDIKLCDK